MKTTRFIKEENPTLFIRHFFVVVVVVVKLYKSIQATNKSTSLKKQKRNNLISCN